jgi:hypothetical protein
MIFTLTEELIWDKLPQNDENNFQVKATLNQWIGTNSTGEPKFDEYQSAG